MYFVKIIIP